MTRTGDEAFAWLREGHLLDSILTGLDVRKDGYVVHLELTFVPQFPHQRRWSKLRVELRELRLFDFGWNADRNDFFFINQSPVILRDGDAFYLSLDPYLERANQPDERDASCFRARALVVIDE